MTLIQQSLQHFRLQSQQKFLTCQSFQIDTDWKNILVTENWWQKNGDKKWWQMSPISCLENAPEFLNRNQLLQKLHLYKRKLHWYLNNAIKFPGLPIWPIRISLCVGGCVGFKITYQKAVDTTSSNKWKPVAIE